MDAYSLAMGFLGGFLLAWFVYAPKPKDFPRLSLFGGSLLWDETFPPEAPPAPVIPSRTELRRMAADPSGWEEDWDTRR